MFDLGNLNDYEFENLCKDIMERKLQKDLYTFSKGVDSGIDICDIKSNPKIVIQVKHYVKSSFSSLRTSLKNEVDKVNKIEPESYYICTSRSLTRNNKKEIYDMFSGYMGDISNIIDEVEINAFLVKQENQDIIEKHYKLWLCASNVLSLVNNQNVFIDCSALMDDINESIRLFVKTQSYNEAKRS